MSPADRREKEKEKWERKQRQEKLEVIDKHLKIILFGFECLQRSVEWDLGYERIRHHLSGIALKCRETREAIALHFTDLTRG